jgi:transposase
MATALSMDLRKRIIEARERGDTFAKIAREKGVTERAVYNLVSLYKETGSYAPRPRNDGRKSLLSDDTKAKITAKITEQPDITLDEIIEEFKLEICRSALSKIVRFKLGFDYKKNPSRQWQVATSCD